MVERSEIQAMIDHDVAVLRATMVAQFEKEGELRMVIRAADLEALKVALLEMNRRMLELNNLRKENQDDRAKYAETTVMMAALEALKLVVMNEIGKTEAHMEALLDPKTGVYQSIDESSKLMSGKALAFVIAVVLLLLGILFKAPLGLN